MKKLLIAVLFVGVAVCALGDYTVTQSDYDTYAGRHDELIQEKVDDGHVAITLPDFSPYYAFKDPVKVASGCRIYLEEGVVIYAMPDNFTNLHRVGIFEVVDGVNDVQIIGLGINKPILKYYDFYKYKITMTTNDNVITTNKVPGYPTKHGILVQDASNVEIDNIKFSFCPGDGVCIYEELQKEGVTNERTRAVTVKNIDTYRCARSGVVITGRENINVLNSRIRESGKANLPGQFTYDQGEGVHIECYNPPMWKLLVSNVVTEGCTRGLKVSFARTNNDTAINRFSSDIRIKNCWFDDSSDYGLMFRNCYDGVLPGIVEVVDCVVTNSEDGAIRFQNWGQQVKVKLTTTDLFNAPDSDYAPVSVYYHGNDPTLTNHTLSSIGNIHLNCVTVWENSHTNILSLIGGPTSLVDNVWGNLYSNGTTKDTYLLNTTTNIDVYIGN